MTNSYQHSSASDITEMPSLARAYSEMLSLFEEILQNGADLRIRVTGRSMAPFLKGGEVITIKRIDCSSLRKGDLILFRNSHDAPVLHRIIKMQKASDGGFRFITRGDALRTFDEEIPGTSVLGRVLQIERTLPSGNVRQVEMDSLLNRSRNSLIAGIGNFKVQAYSILVWLKGKRRRKDLLTGC